MNSEKSYENSKEDNKALKRFIPILIISMIVGGVCGAITGIIQENLAQIISDGITNFLSIVTPYINFVLTIIIGGVIYYFYRKARKLFKLWNGEDEEQINYIEMLLSYAQWGTAILMILAFFFFAAGFSGLVTSGSSSSLSLNEYIIHFVLFMSGFIVANTFVVILQQRIVNFEKEINPEKKGSVFDIKFAKKWIDSCDEAERLNTYQAAYKSYQVVYITCTILLMLSIFGMMIWDIGYLPSALITIIWLVQTSSYCLESIRLSKYKNKK